MKKLISIALVMWTISSSAQNESKLFDEFIQKALKSTPMVPGIGIAVVKDGKTILAKGYGYADPDNGVKATAETSYYIASITKSFTGMLALMLADEGRIDLDVPLTTYKPFKNLKNKDVFENITIRELLNHTSGIENGYIVFREAYTGDKSLEILTMLLEEKTELRKDGKTYKYDNLGYNIFAILLEAEFGWKWQDLLQQRIFSPFGMKNTSAYISKAAKEKWSLAWPYNGYLSSKPERENLMKNDAMMQSAGGMILSATDAANWMKAYINNGKLNGKQVVKPALIQASLFPTVSYSREGDIFNDEGYGVGWISAKFKDKKINYHFGGFTGFFSHISIMPEKNVGIAVFCNETAFGKNIANLIASFIYDYYLGNVDSADDYDEQIQALEKRILEAQAGIKKHFDDLSKREWKLELPKSAYQGTYTNRHVGTMVIAERSDELHISMGPMKAIATPYTKDNSIRVEFAGSGSVLLFDVKDGKVINMNYDGDIFERIE
jgi:CubicO group peptidase (beta-lactamase class C family)